LPPASSVPQFIRSGIVNGFTTPDLKLAATHCHEFAKLNLLERSRRLQWSDSVVLYKDFCEQYSISWVQPE